jgi:hypothetical protein
MRISSTTTRSIAPNTLVSDTMYIAKFNRTGIQWKIDLYEKKWSEEMLSNEISLINTHKFFFHTTAKRWVRNEIVKQLVNHHGLEIING